MAERAGYRSSKPDCRPQTLGPGAGPLEVASAVKTRRSARPDTESPRHRLDQALLRVGGLPVAQFPDGGVGDRLPSDLPDQGRDLGVGVRAAAGGMRCRISQFIRSASVRKGGVLFPPCAASPGITEPP